MQKKGEKKLFVLDTNVLMSTHGKAIFGFKDNDVIITTTTLEELDNCKSYIGEAGYEAREAIRTIYQLLRSSEKSALNGIPLPGGGNFYIEAKAPIQSDLAPYGMRMDKPDNCIIGSVIAIENREPFFSESEPGRKVILVTNDIAMKIKAETANINVETYHNDRNLSEYVYTGRAEIAAKVRKDYSSDINDLRTGKNVENTYQLEENQYAVLKYGTDSILAKVKNNHLVKLNDVQTVYGGIMPRNSGQRFALDALLTPVDEIPLVILSGPAGCGKTLLSIAAGLDQTSYDRQNETYRKMVIMRSNTLSDNDQGFLKGDLNEKMMPLLAPYFDNLEFLFSSGDTTRDEVQTLIDDRLESGSIEIGCFAYIRGRSFANTYLIIDEAQNLTRNQAKTLVTRVGVGTKLIIMGDMEQIDNPKLNKDNNGLAYLIEKFKGSRLCAQVMFTADECVRSALANEALERL